MDASLRWLHEGNQFPPWAPFWFVLAAGRVTALAEQVRLRDGSDGKVVGSGDTAGVYPAFYLTETEAV